MVLEQNYGIATQNKSFVSALEKPEHAPNLLKTWLFLI
jgi:hypothetical protein